MKKIYDIISFISAILGIIGFFFTLFAMTDIQGNIISFFLGITLTILCVIIHYYIKSIPKYTEIEGLRIEEADNIPLFVPRKNQLNPINVVHTCEINGQNAILEFEYYGLCCDKNGCEHFATSSYSHDITDIKDMDWYAFDLKSDPHRKNPIKPTPVTPRGATSRVVFHFINRIKYNTVFHYFTHQFIKNSVNKSGKDYYVSTVLYKDRPLNSYCVQLKFHELPKTIRVYSIDRRKGKYLYQLTDYTQTDGVFTYTDNITDGNAWSIRCYIFDR